MKKFIVVITVFCCLGFPLAADVYRTSCGIEFTSVDIEAFDSTEDLYDWLIEMDELFCGPN